MIFDRVSGTQMQAARMLTGATMVGFLVARLFGCQASRVRTAIARLYIAGVLGFSVYALF
jgi:hypothetical protein